MYLKKNSDLLSAINKLNNQSNPNKAANPISIQENTASIFF
jgi:hypothetical protein